MSESLAFFDEGRIIIALPPSICPCCVPCLFHDTNTDRWYLVVGTHVEHPEAIADPTAPADDPQGFIFAEGPSPDTLTYVREFPMWTRINPTDAGIMTYNPEPIFLAVLFGWNNTEPFRVAGLNYDDSAPRSRQEEPATAH